MLLSTSDAETNIVICVARLSAWLKSVREASYFKAFAFAAGTSAVFDGMTLLILTANSFHRDSQQFIFSRKSTLT